MNDRIHGSLVAIERRNLFQTRRCEVTQVPSTEEPTRDDNGVGFVPEIHYNLFATVNHFGNMQSGHYMANIKVDSTWYHCNDAHVSRAGVGTGAAEVLAADGAYLLFYIR